MGRSHQYFPFAILVTSPDPAQLNGPLSAMLKCRPGLFFFSSPLQDMVFLHSHSCPGTLFVDKAGLKTREIHLFYALGCMCYHAWQRGVLLSLWQTSHPLWISIREGTWPNSAKDLGDGYMETEWFVQLPTYTSCVGWRLSVAFFQLMHCP